MEQNEPLFGLSLDNSVNGYLRETAKWSRFLAIVGFIGLGLGLIIFLFMILVGFSSFQTADPYNQYPGYEKTLFMSRGIATVFGLVFIVLYFFPLMYLYRFGTQMRDALNANDQEKLTTAFKNLKSVFRFMGILTIIILALYALVFILALVFGAAASM